MRQLLQISLFLIAVGIIHFMSGEAEGKCPANGNAHSLYVTTNMGDNIYSFDTSGRFVGNVINVSTFPKDMKVQKLRTMSFGPGEHLYAASSKGKLSSIFAVSGNGKKLLEHECMRSYVFTVVKQDSETNPWLDHPYSFVFHPKTNVLYVANQNSVSVTWYDVSEASKNKPATAMKSSDGVNQGLQELHRRGQDHVQGTSVNKSAINLDSPKATIALFASGWNPFYSLSSVRGIALSPELIDAGAENPTPMYLLLVCDITADSILVLDSKTGHLLWSYTNVVPSPVQIVFPKETHDSPPTALKYFYATSKHGSVFRVELRRGQHTSQVIVAPHTRIESASAILQNPVHDTLLVGDRTGHRISVFATPEMGKGAPFLGTFHRHLFDQPESLLFVDLVPRKDIGTCLELAENGDFKFSTICLAGEVWMFLIAGIVAMIVFGYCWRYAHKQRQYTAPTTTTLAEEETATLVNSGGKKKKEYGTV